VGRAAQLLNGAYVVQVTQNGSIERGLASLRPDWNGRAAEPGTAYLGNVFASQEQPAIVIDERENLRGAGRQATQEALALAFNRLGQQAVVGYTTGPEARNLYHSMDAPGQRVEFTNVTIDRERLQDAMANAYSDDPDGDFPMPHPRLTEALSAPDADAALAGLARSARDALNARDSNGQLLPVTVRSASGFTHLADRLEPHGEVLNLPAGVVRYDFRFRAPEGSQEAAPGGGGSGPRPPAATPNDSDGQPGSRALRPPHGGSPSDSVQRSPLRRVLSQPRFDPSSSSEFMQQTRAAVDELLADNRAVRPNLTDAVGDVVLTEALERASGARTPNDAAARVARYVDTLRAQPQTLALVGDRADRIRAREVDAVVTGFVRDQGFPNADRLRVLDQIRPEVRGMSAADAGRFLSARYANLDAIRLLAGRAGVSVPDPSYRPSRVQEMAIPGQDLRVRTWQLVNAEMGRFTSRRGWNSEQQAAVNRQLAPELAGQSVRQAREYLASNYASTEQLNALAERAGVPQPTPRPEVVPGSVQQTPLRPRSEVLPDLVGANFLQPNPREVIYGFGALPLPTGAPRIDSTPPQLADVLRGIGNAGRWQARTAQRLRNDALTFAGRQAWRLAPTPIQNAGSAAVRLTEGTLHFGGQAWTTVARAAYRLTSFTVPSAVREAFSNAGSGGSLAGQSLQRAYLSDASAALQTVAFNGAAVALLLNAPRVEPFAGQFNGANPTLGEIQALTFAPKGASTVGLSLSRDSGSPIEIRVGVLGDVGVDSRRGVNRLQGNDNLAFMSTMFRRVTQGQAYAFVGVSRESLPFLRFQVASQFSPFQVAMNPPGMIGTDQLPNGGTGGTLQAVTQASLGPSTLDLSGVTIGPVSLLNRKAVSPELISLSSSAGKGGVPINSLAAIVSGNPFYLSNDPQVMEQLRQFRNGLPEWLKPLHDGMANMVIPNPDPTHPVGWHGIKEALDVPVSGGNGGGERAP
jgi:hypothetical protein